MFEPHSLMFGVRLKNARRKGSAFESEIEVFTEQAIAAQGGFQNLWAAVHCFMETSDRTNCEIQCDLKSKAASKAHRRRC